MELPERVVEACRNAGRNVARRLFLDRQIELWMGELDLASSLHEVRARVTAVIRETDDARTFVLRPNRRWRGHRAGQYASVEVEIDGVRTRRFYSLSSAPGEDLAITVKRVAGGRVSNWLHDHVQVGDLVRLGEPAGDFVLPEPAPERLLLMSGGSGITPLAAIVRDLAARGAIRDIVWLHHARSLHDVIFRDAIDALAAGHSGLRRIWCLDDEPGGPRGFDEARTAALVPDFAERATFVCAPPAMMSRVEAMWRSAGAERLLRRERFTLSEVQPAANAQEVVIRLSRCQRMLAANTGESLLVQLQRAGERPPSGCGIGICRTCITCKRSGVVRNLVSGATSGGADEEIQLCVSAACSDLELNL